VNKKYCTTCQTMRNEDGGIWIQSKIKRWQCAPCATRKNISIYASKSTRERLQNEGRTQ